MGNSLLKSAVWRTGGYTASLILFSLFYIVGAAGGYLIYIFKTIELPALTVPVWNDFIRFIWYYCKFLVITFLCGYSALGVIAGPALITARGYLMCAYVIDIISTGRVNASELLYKNALVSLVSLICLFVLSISGFRHSVNLFKAMTGRRRSFPEPGFTSRHLIRFIICIILIILAGVINIVIYPAVSGFIN